MDTKTNIYDINFWARIYFIALVLSPFICYIDYLTIEQGFYRIYGSTVLLLSIMLLFVRGGHNIVLRDYVVVGVILALYYVTWDIILWQNTIARKGVFYEFMLNLSLHAVAILFLVDNLTFPKKLIDNLVLIMKWLVVIGAVVSLLQVLISPFLFTPDSFYEFMMRYRWGTDPLHVRRLSIFGFTNINDIGFSFLPMMALIVGYEVKEKNRIPYLMLILGFFIAIVNNSRYIQVGYFIAIMPLLFYQQKILRNILVSIIGGVVLVGLMFLLLDIIGYDVGLYIEDRLLSDSYETRFLAFELFMNFFPDKPFFGTGEHITDDLFVALNERSSQIHVGYLSHLFSYGVVGTSIAMLFWGLITLRLWRVARRTGFYGSFFGFLIFWWANVTIVYYNIASFGLMLCYLFSSFYDRKSEENSNSGEVGN